MVEPRHVHLVAVKHVMRYLKGTLYYGLRYAVDCDLRLCGYNDSDWEGSVEDRKSNLGGCFSLELGMISWFSRKHTIISLSMVEAEYIASCSTCSEAVWLQKMLAGLFD